jgi:hypothetical protein
VGEQAALLAGWKPGKGRAKRPRQSARCLRSGTPALPALWLDTAMTTYRQQELLGQGTKIRTEVAAMSSVSGLVENRRQAGRPTSVI